MMFDDSSSVGDTPSLPLPPRLAVGGHGRRVWPIQISFAAHVVVASAGNGGNLLKSLFFVTDEHDIPPDALTFPLAVTDAERARLSETTGAHLYEYRPGSDIARLIHRSDAGVPPEGLKAHIAKVPQTVRLNELQVATLTCAVSQQLGASAFRELCMVTQSATGGHPED